MYEMYHEFSTADYVVMYLFRGPYLVVSKGTGEGGRPSSQEAPKRPPTCSSSYQRLCKGGT